ncbi:MAG: hypothetical protein LBM23_07820 [Propionibacteriaceae bacterium]|jgi:hypothetical protein|nr:hypothetical protein [Propionibacteriaceae bacterium]
MSPYTRPLLLGSSHRLDDFEPSKKPFSMLASTMLAAMREAGMEPDRTGLAEEIYASRDNDPIEDPWERRQAEADAAPTPSNS